jgi:hypothetical protein
MLERHEMKLTTQQAYALLEKHGSYITEICDRCGKGIGPVRFTRKDDAGVWCSRECRNGKEAHAPGTCKGCGASLAGERKGTKFCDDTCRVRFNRRSQTTRNSTDTPRILKPLTGAGGGLGCLYTKAPEKRLTSETR